MITFHYDNNLDIEKFSHVLDDTNQCYKFYWLDAILTLISYGNTTMEFNEIINEMIADAYYSVSEYHLHLGLRNGEGVITDSLERAVLKLIDATNLKSTASRDEILREISLNEKVILAEKKNLSLNVPYRLLSSFLPEIKGNSKLWGQSQKFIEYINLINQSNQLPYIIHYESGLKKTVTVSKEWNKFFKDNMVTLKGWIRDKKVRYLQDRNPGVPGIVYKLEPENEKARKLNNVRKLWTSIMDITPVSDIYTGNSLNKGRYEVDHFVPWSYVASDEMWNLMPMDSSLNSSKSNHLPEWNKYFPKFVDNQYLLYEVTHEYDEIRKKFDICHRDNLNSLWASEKLYIEGNSKEQFTNILEENMKPVYDAAHIQGYTMWNYFNCA